MFTDIIHVDSKAVDESVHVQLLPCCIEYDGPAPVSQYFRPVELPGDGCIFVSVAPIPTFENGSNNSTACVLCVKIVGLT